MTAKNDNDSVTISIDLKLPRQYHEFYDRLIALGADIGDLSEIAAGGIIGYLNVLHEELSGILTYAAPDIRKNLSLSN